MGWRAFPSPPSENDSLPPVLSLSLSLSSLFGGATGVNLSRALLSTQSQGRSRRRRRRRKRRVETSNFPQGTEKHFFFCREKRSCCLVALLLSAAVHFF